MVTLLDKAGDKSIDPSDAPPPSLSHLCRTDGPGRPRIEIDPQALSMALVLEPKTTLASVRPGTDLRNPKIRGTFIVGFRRIG